MYILNQVNRYPWIPLNSLWEAVSVLLKHWLPPTWNTKILSVLTAGWEGKREDSTYRKYKFTLFIHCYHHGQFGHLSVSRYLCKAFCPSTKGPQQICRMHLSWSIDVFEDLNFIDLYSSSIHYKEKNPSDFKQCLLKGSLIPWLRSQQGLQCFH